MSLPPNERNPLLVLKHSCMFIVCLLELCSTDAFALLQGQARGDRTAMFAWRPMCSRSRSHDFQELGGGIDIDNGILDAEPLTFFGAYSGLTVFTDFRTTLAVMMERGSSVSSRSD